MITFKHTGNFNKIESWLIGAAKKDWMSLLNMYGQEGIRALESATPVDTGLTAMSWNYTISRTLSSYKIDFTNSNIQNGVNIAIILEFGHGTRNGGYVQGRDYINPAIRPVFDRLADTIWKEVTK